MEVSKDNAEQGTASSLGHVENLTKREYFAATALQAILHAYTLQGEIDPDASFVAEQAFAFADIMIEKSHTTLGK